MPKKLPKNTAYAQALITRESFPEFRDFFLMHPQYTQTHKDEVDGLDFDYFILNGSTYGQIENPEKILQDGALLRRRFNPNIHFCYHCVPDEEFLAKYPFTFKDNRNQLAWDLDFRLNEAYVKTKHPVLDRFEKRVIEEKESGSYILGLSIGFKIEKPSALSLYLDDGGFRSAMHWGPSEDLAFSVVSELYGKTFSPLVYADRQLHHGLPTRRNIGAELTEILKRNENHGLKRVGFQGALQLFDTIRTHSQLKYPISFRSFYGGGSGPGYTPFPPDDIVDGVSLQEDWRNLYRDMDPYIEWSYAKVHGECFGTRDGRNHPEVFAIAEAMLYGYPLPVIGMDYIQMGELLLGPKKNKRAKIICYRHPEGFILTVQGAPGGGLEWLNANTPWVWDAESPVMVKDFSESNEDSANGGWDFQKKIPTRAELQPLLAAKRPSTGGEDEEDLSSLLPSYFNTPAAHFPPPATTTAECEAFLQRLEAIDFFEAYPPAARGKAISQIKWSFSPELSPAYEKFCANDRRHEQTQKQQAVAALAKNPAPSLGFMRFYYEETADQTVALVEAQSLGLFAPRKFWTVWESFPGASESQAHEEDGLLDLGFTLGGAKVQHRFFGMTYHSEILPWVLWRAFRDTPLRAHFLASFDSTTYFTICTPGAWKRFQDAGLELGSSRFSEQWNAYLEREVVRVRLFKAGVAQILKARHPGNLTGAEKEKIKLADEIHELGQVMEIWRQVTTEESGEYDEDDEKQKAKELAGWYWYEEFGNYESLDVPYYGANPQGPYDTKEKAMASAQEQCGAVEFVGEEA